MKLEKTALMESLNSQFSWSSKLQTIEQQTEYWSKEILKKYLLQIY